MNSSKLVLAALRLELGFAQSLAQFQACILLALCLFWLFTRWEQISERFSRDNLGPTLLGCICLFGMFLTYMFTDDWGSEYFFLAATIGASIALAFCDGAISVCMFIALMFLRPWEIIQNNDYFSILPKLTMSLCIMNLLIDFGIRRKVEFQWDKLSKYLLIYTFWLFVTSFRAPDVAASQNTFTDTFIKYIFMFFIIKHLARDRRELDLVMWTMIITMLGVGAASIAQTLDCREQARLTGAEIAADELRLVGFGAFENANDIAAILVMVLPFCFVQIFRKNAHWIARAVGAITVAVAITALAMAASRGAQLAVVAMIVIYVLIRMKNRTHAIFIAAGCAVVVMAATSASGRSSSDLDESKKFRMIYIESGIQMGIRNPLFGVGFDGYADAFTTYQTGEVDGTLHRTAHNSWVLAFAETGFIGVGLFLAVFVAAVRPAWHIREERPEFLLALLGYGIAITFLSHTYLMYPYLLYGVTAVAVRNYYEPGASTPPPPGAGALGSDLLPQA